MNKLKLLSVATMVSMLVSCNNANTTEQAKENKEPVKRKIDKASWVLGKWNNATPEGMLTENWERQNDTLYTGASYLINGKDTLFSEAIQIAQNNSDLLYIPIVKGQNADKPVTFTLTSASDSLLVFENPQHDFPQKITYALIKKDSLLAEISGTMNEKPHAEQFPMSRAK